MKFGSGSAALPAYVAAPAGGKPDAAVVIFSDVCVLGVALTSFPMALLVFESIALTPHGWFERRERAVWALQNTTPSNPAAKPAPHTERPPKPPSYGWEPTNAQPNPPPNKPAPPNPPKNR